MCVCVCDPGDGENEMGKLAYCPLILIMVPKNRLFRRRPKWKRVRTGEMDENEEDEWFILSHQQLRPRGLSVINSLFGALHAR